MCYLGVLKMEKTLREKRRHKHRSYSNGEWKGNLKIEWTPKLENEMKIFLIVLIFSLVFLYIIVVLSGIILDIINSSLKTSFGFGHFFEVIGGVWLGLIFFFATPIHKWVKAVLKLSPKYLLLKACEFILIIGGITLLIGGVWFYVIPFIF